MKSKRKNNLFYTLLFLAPAMAIFFVLSVYPLLRTLQLSLQGARGEYTLKNFINVFTGPALWETSRITVLFAVISTAFEMVIGFAFALVLNQRFFGRKALRTIFLIPWVIPTAIMAVGWKFILQHSYGPFPWLLYWLGITKEVPYFLIMPRMAFISLIIADVWKTVPFCALLLLAGLQMIPEQLYEAADIDGAGSIQKFILITLPLMIPTIVVTLMFRFLQAFGIFDLVWVLTGGGPGDSTLTLSVAIYREALRYINIGRGSAMAVVMAIYVVGILTVIRVMRKSLGKIYEAKA
ncbi:sugar ABC transporter permease [Candidatus Aerophobetes bacterium]|uniref:Sugar ABC transporter permease n=1 Tax=Aerophobetes bacterium TaxID=2030807 RepID=A0A662DA29_UNCAE|nr:MAG: sugar ABC transporter permease [Candidatus Aerophobetes bacterium]